MFEHIKKNIVSYLIPVLIAASWAGFIALMDARHEMKGQAEKTAVELQLREVRRDIRQTENYLEQAPSEVYDAARRANLRELKDEAEELKEKLESIEVVK